MLARELGNGVVPFQMSLRQLLDIGKHRIVLIFHMFANRLKIFVIETYDEHGDVVAVRAIDGFNQFATDVRKIEIQEIFVRLFQVADQRGQRHILEMVISARHIIHHRQKRLLIHMMRPAYLPDRFVAEPQRNIETPQDQNQRTVIPDQIAHFIACLITVRIIHPFFENLC